MGNYYNRAEFLFLEICQKRLNILIKDNNKRNYYCVKANILE